MYLKYIYLSGSDPIYPCQLGAQGLDLGLDLGVLFQAALQEPVGQVELCLYAVGRKVVGVGQAVVRVPEIFQLDVALINETGETIIDTAQGHTHVSTELSLGPPGVLGQEAVIWGVCPSQVIVINELWVQRRGFFALRAHFLGGKKAGFKDFEPCYGCWYWVLASRLFWTEGRFVFTAAAPP